jgi:hypothetical protein
MVGLAPPAGRRASIFVQARYNPSAGEGSAIHVFAGAQCCSVSGRKSNHGSSFIPSSFSENVFKGRGQSRQYYNRTLGFGCGACASVAISPRIFQVATGAPLRALPVQEARFTWRLAGTLVALFLVSAADAHAGSARDYLNAPIDSWLTTYNAGYATAVTPEDGTTMQPGTRSNAYVQSLVISRTMDFWGRTGGLSVVLPYAFLDAKSGPFQASANGVSDVGFLWQMNIFGGPALTREQFRSFVPQTFASFHLYVGTPLGTYDASSPINPSNNRWTIVPTVNYSYTPDRGRTWIETYVSAELFTNNYDFRVNGAQVLYQDPIFRLEEHVSHNLTDKLWLSVDAYYNYGGATSIDGVAQNNRANTVRIGPGIGAGLWRGADLVVNYEQVVAKPAREPDAKTVRLTIRQLW